MTQVAGQLGSDKSQVSRTLKVLADHGLVERDSDTLAYRLGWRVFMLAARAGEERLADAAPASLRRLVAALGEGAHLSVLRGTEVLTVFSEAPAHGVQAVNWVGRVVPAACASAGYALLADHERSDSPGIHPRRVVSQAPSTRAAECGCFWERLVDTRSRGYAIVDEEFEPGLSAVGAPVRDFRGHIVAAVNVSGPSFRFADRVEDAGEQVVAAAVELSHTLGWPGG